VDAKLPAFLRIDKNVQLEREKLADYFRQYMEFDIDDLDKEVRASLLRQIDEASREYGAHKQRVVDEVRIVQELNNGMKGLHSKTVEARNELNHDISQAMHKCKQNLSIIEHQNGEKQRLRLKLLEM